MKKTRVAYLISIITILAIFLVGCGSQSTKSPEKNNASSSSQTSKPKQVVNLPKPTKSKVLRKSIYSANLQRKWHYFVYLPKNYHRLVAQNYHFPVIYLLHGMEGAGSNFFQEVDSKNYLDQLETAYQQKAVVIAPSYQNSFMLNYGKGADYENAFMKELIPKTTATYHLQNANGRSLLGISMGGYVSSRLSLKYPNSFKSVMLISPAVWKVVPPIIQANPQAPAFKINGRYSQKLYDSLFPTKYLKRYLSVNQLNTKFYVESSREDTTVPFINVETFVKNLKQAGIPVTFIADNFGGHTWPYWQIAVRQGYNFLLK